MKMTLLFISIKVLFSAEEQMKTQNSDNMGLKQHKY